MSQTRPLKIVLLSYHNHNGGAAIACGRLHDALEKAGHQVTTLVQEKTGEDSSISLAVSAVKKWMAFLRFVAERLYFARFERNKSIRFLFNPGIFGQDISQHPAIQEADIIHLHWVNFGFLSIRSIEKLLQLNKPVFWTLHDMWAFTGGCHHSGDCKGFEQTCGHCKFLAKPEPQDLSHQLWAKKMKQFHYHNLQIITCSDWLGNRAKSSSILNGTPIKTIANPIDVAIFQQGDATQAKISLGLNPDKQYLLFVAMRVSAPEKGFSYLKTALHQWAIEHPLLVQQTELLVVGEISDPEIMQSLALNIHTLGKVQDVSTMIKAYQSSAMFITPSLEENLPNTIMEAMACGTPCLGFEVGGIPEMIDHEVNGYVAQKLQAADLCRGISYILPQSEKLGQEARKKVATHYESSIIANKHLQFYQTSL
ncbi:glycosyltransferase [Aquirufa aurantiipilula]|uniref:Glycosyltransferase n=1 Tax=Aquirufa aurantiipilula TaxID=2696561 RepID=A0ABT6BMN6_9BACT|nr:glycosyltransferase [Aquirufa aurantiipilula]MDF5691745.1 glycosyltransferase [Aquirufa aurantiipilula]